jgi:hypothetical protein
MGWNPGKLPMRGNISSAPIRECPEPNMWTRPSVAIASAKTPALASIAADCVVATRSRTARAASSQRGAADSEGAGMTRSW